MSLDIDGTFSNSVSLPFTNLKFEQAKSYGLRINAKFYPKTEFLAERFYYGPYLKQRYSKSPLYRHNRITMGLMTGYKNLFPNKIYFDIGAGLGFRVHSSIRNITGDYLDGIIGTNFFGGIVDFFTGGVGKLDITTRLTIGYRIKGNARPRKIKDKKAMALYP